MSMAAPGAIPPPPRKPLAQQLIDYGLIGFFVVLLGIGFNRVEIPRITRLFTDSQHIRDYAGQFMHPDFGMLNSYIEQMWLTIQIAIWGTFLAIFLAVPLGLLCARNIAPFWLQFPMRRFIDLLRAVPDLVIGTLFLVTIGLSPAAGVMALAINTGGVLAKLFSEAVEAIDRAPVEGVRSTGAGRLQEIVWGVIPQVAPLWTSYALYRFESNSRSATVLGLIGAGGIGQVLFETLNAFQYERLSAIILVIIAAVFAIDLLSQAIRSRLT
jgi:phosphonate transport system permease protein